MILSPAIFNSIEITFEGKKNKLLSTKKSVPGFDRRLFEDGWTYDYTDGWTDRQTDGRRKKHVEVVPHRKS